MDLGVYNYLFYLLISSLRLFGKENTLYALLFFFNTVNMQMTWFGNFQNITPFRESSTEH